MNKIEWCMKQKGGIEAIRPNENLSKAYIKKAEDALKAATSLKGNPDWEISSLYYSMYFSLYSILMKIGVKCGIHSCTISFMEHSLNNYFTAEDIKLVQKSMKARIDAQYYSNKNISSRLYEKMKKEAPSFLVKCKKILLDISINDVEKIRTRINFTKN